MTLQSVSIKQVCWLLRVTLCWNPPKHVCLSFSAVVQILFSSPSQRIFSRLSVPAAFVICIFSLTSDLACSHLLSLSFSDGKSSPRFISVPVQVSALPDYNGTDIYPLFFSTQPIETGSYSLDITDVFLSPSSSFQGISHARLHHHHRDRKSRGTHRFSSSRFPVSPFLRHRVHEPVPHQREPINPRRSLVAPSLLHVLSGLSKRGSRCGILGRAVDAVPRIRDFWNYTKRKGGV